MKKLSVLEQFKKLRQNYEGGLFGVICGPRLSGKTTLAGTLPGKSVLIYPELEEAGPGSAEAMAARQKNDLTVVTFRTLYEGTPEYPSLMQILGMLREDAEIDNVYIDGLSAISDMIHASPHVQTMLKADVWGAFREIGGKLSAIMDEGKRLTTTDVTKYKNVFFTMALAPKLDAVGNLIDVSFDVKGNVAVTQITKKCPLIGVLTEAEDEDGNKVGAMLTKKHGPWPARIDGLLDEDNPGVIGRDLGELLNLIKTKGTQQ